MDRAQHPIPVPPSMSSLATLRALSDLISSSISEIENRYKTLGVDFPDLNEPSIAETEAARSHPTIAKASAIAAAAATQLIAMVQPPVTTLLDMSCGLHRSSTLQTVLVSNTVECIREGDKNGMHVSEIAEKVHLNDAKLARVLRYLANNHIFREVAPDVFANNRLSSMLDTGKSLSDLQAKPLERHVGSSGIAAVLEFLSDEMFKGGAYMAESLVDPQSRDSLLTTHCGFNKAFKTDLNLFAWFELPENLYRLKRFGSAVNCVDDNLLEDFNWNGLERGSIVVDVGGGIGNTTMALRRRYPHLRFVVQDHAAVMQEGDKFWQETFPEALETGSVKLQANDFMQPQPVKDASVFILRMVLHDWLDPSAEQILQHLRDAATPETKLLVVENTVGYLCPDTNDYGDIPGAKLPMPPAPLLANVRGNSSVYVTNLVMLVTVNAQERKVLEFRELFAKTGWKLAYIYRTDGIMLQTILAVPK